jgi:hypothetical protein
MDRNPRTDGTRPVPRKHALPAVALALSSCTVFQDDAPIYPSAPPRIAILYGDSEVANSNHERWFRPEVYCRNDYSLTGDVFALPQGFPARFTVAVAKDWEPLSEPQDDFPDRPSVLIEADDWRPMRAEVILHGGTFTGTEPGTTVQSTVRNGQNVEIASREFGRDIRPSDASFSFSVVPISGTYLLGRDTVELSAQVVSERGDIEWTSDPIIGSPEALCGPQ